VSTILHGISPYMSYFIYFLWKQKQPWSSLSLHYRLSLSQSCEILDTEVPNNLVKYWKWPSWNSRVVSFPSSALITGHRDNYSDSMAGRAQHGGVPVTQLSSQKQKLPQLQANMGLLPPPSLLGKKTVWKGLLGMFFMSVWNILGDPIFL
jgi:hypothetical protein